MWMKTTTMAVMTKSVLRLVKGRVALLDLLPTACLTARSRLSIALLVSMRQSIQIVEVAFTGEYVEPAL